MKEQFPNNQIGWVTIDGNQTYDDIHDILHELTVLLPFLMKNCIIYVVGDQNTRPQLNQAHQLEWNLKQDIFLGFY